MQKYIRNKQTEIDRPFRIINHGLSKYITTQKLGKSKTNMSKVHQAKPRSTTKLEGLHGQQNHSMHV